jgi:hypothetical protein
LTAIKEDHFICYTKRVTISQLDNWGEGGGGGTTVGGFYIWYTLTRSKKFKVTALDHNDLYIQTVCLISHFEKTDDMNFN